MIGRDIAILWFQNMWLQMSNLQEFVIKFGASLATRLWGHYSVLSRLLLEHANG
jgi:hypothetical protein